jgi:pimeloyl-ACP methyl ester carboxylesterase
MPYRPNRTTLPSGTSVTYEEMGAGPLMLMIPGGGADSRSWREVAGAFQSHYRVLVPNLRGWGGTDDLEGYENVHDVLMNRFVAPVREGDATAVRYLIEGWYGEGAYARLSTQVRACPGVGLRQSR